MNRYTTYPGNYCLTAIPISQGREYPPEEIYAWDKFFWDNFWAPSQAVGGVRVDTVYTDQIIGGQVNIWEGNSGHAIPKLRPRLPAVVERVWNYDAGVGYSSFKSRFEHTDSILTKLIN